ncbi:PQQ-binding-like beta-propeller repeat protein [Alteraurantiacibacter aestuarii]|uniref:PQQ-binding-like beta-propeller repeat protein n=1 Tax=Alteraurantiacibacter aestuarii TaxID=650004 RepID=A0A844ZFU0_9SPHN|nr:PQQ-binding-like beta-propeller repeat protein [Alteraurantiacibacter aestuarii]MXO87391.1 PQQ-binding-like beta-propeller repeat protein [Alteraurantiacibacter aestuarii]
MAVTNWAAKASLGVAIGVLAIAQAGGQTLSDFTPVTDADIQNPDPADWLSWRRTLDSWGYSPLAQITRDNVASLRMVWARPLNTGSQEGTPLVHDGVMYFPAPGDVIEAIDARSGQLIWQYRRDIPEDIGNYLPVWDTNRNLAIYGNLIIANGADDYIYALDARTGEMVWETRIMDYRNGAKQSSGPIIAEGLAITGRSCEPEGGPDACVITAHNALTGEEVWRTSTIARGDDPNDATWGGVPLEDRQQVGAWMVASYDPELRLIYMGTSVSAPAPKISLAGPDYDYLYHNSTLALDVETGRIVWHYQHLVDHWDLDHPFPRMLVDEAVAPDPSEVTWINPAIEAGRTYKVLTGVPGKTGVIYTLDRETGQFLWARPTIHQNVVGDIDGATGRVTVNPETIFTAFGAKLTVCPAPSGGTNYPAGAYSPLTSTMYLTSNNSCAEMAALDPADNPGVYGMSSRQYIAPGANNNVGVIHAVNAVTGRTLWEFSTRTGMQSLMTTGGGLLFAGDADGRFRAMDQHDGAVLWEMNLGSSVTGYPATFEVDGQQYVAVSTGRWLNDSFTPELTHGTQNTLYVFALPQAGIGHAGPYRAPINPAGRLSSVDPALNNPALNNPGGGFARHTADGVYSAAQARAGQAVYERACAACHGVDFQPAPGSPTLKGGAFMANWRGKSVGDLFAYTRGNMPVAAGGSLPDSQYLAVIAYLLEANDFPAGAALDPDQAMLAAIGIGE